VYCFYLVTLVWSSVELGVDGADWFVLSFTGS